MFFLYSAVLPSVDLRGVAVATNACPVVSCRLFLPMKDICPSTAADTASHH